MASSKQMGLDPNHEITEHDIHDYQLPDDIGSNWRQLARELGYKEANIKSIENEKGNSNKECCIELLVRWLYKKGRDATAGILAEALTRIEHKNLADRLIKSNGDQSQIDKFEKTIREMSEQLDSLREEGSKMRDRNQKLEEEILKLRAIIKELEGARQQERRDFEDTVTLDTKDASVVPTGTDQAARELHIGGRLKNLNQKLHTDVTSLLEVPEIKQDQLKTLVKLDILTRLSKRLQELYSDILAMVAEACKCSEDLKRDFYDFAYHGLRAEHNELIHRVEDLGSTLKETSGDEKNDFERLQQLQVNRRRQVERLDNMWRGLFSPPERLHKTPWSDTTGISDKSKESKKVSRQTDPGARPKQSKPCDVRTNSEAPSANDDDKYEVCLNIAKRKSRKSIFRKTEKDKDECTLLSCSLRRDS